MRIPLALATTLAALLVASARARADDPVPSAAPAPPAAAAPAHGGRLLILGDRAGVFEVVHDLVTGTVTVYAHDDAGKPLALSSAPALLLDDTKDGPRETALVRVPQSADAWSVTDPALKSATVSVKLRARIGGKDLEGSLATEQQPSPAVPSRLEERFEPSHGGRVVMVDRRPFEWVHDAHAGTLTLYAVSEGAGKTPPAVTEATVVLAGDFGRKELTLSSLEGSARAWRAEDPVLKTAMLEGSIRVTVEGKPAEARLVSRGDHGGRLLSLGTDAPHLEVVHDRKKGTFTIYLVQAKGETFAESPVTIADSPVLEVVAPAGAKSLTLLRVEGQSNAWSATDPLLEGKGLRATVRVRIGDKSYEAKIEPHKAAAGAAETPGEGK